MRRQVDWIETFSSLSLSLCPHPRLCVLLLRRRISIVAEEEEEKGDVIIIKKYQAGVVSSEWI